MSKIDELAELIGGVASQIDQTLTASGSSAQEAEGIGSAAAALGADGVVEGLAEVKTQLDALTAVLNSASERAGEIQALTLSVAENG